MVTSDKRPMQPEFTQLLFSLLVSLIALTAHPAEPLPVEAVYQAKIPGIPFSIRAEIRLTQETLHNWKLESIAQAPFARIQETSLLTFEWDTTSQDQEAGAAPADTLPRLLPDIRPLSYTYMQKALGRRRSNSIAFDWQQLRSQSSIKGEIRTREIQVGIQDRLSYQLQLRYDLYNQYQRYQADTSRELPYRILDRDRIRNWTFRVSGEEAVHTPLGKLATVKVMRSNKESGTTLLWMAMDWQFLLVRLLQEDEGDSFELHLQEARLGDRQVEGP